MTSLADRMEMQIRLGTGPDGFEVAGFKRDLEGRGHHGARGIMVLIETSVVERGYP